MKLALEAESLPLATDSNGVVRVGGTRVTLDMVVAGYHMGQTPEQVVLDFSSLRLEDVFTVFGYYLRHRSEVDAYVAEGERRGAELQAEIEAHSSRSQARERVLARQKGRSDTPSRS